MFWNIYLIPFLNKQLFEIFYNYYFNLGYPSDLIESLSEDRARLLEEKKKLEEELSKLRGSSFVPSPYVPTAPELLDEACAPELPGETERSAIETQDEGRVDSAMETSMMSVQ